MFPAPPPVTRALIIFCAVAFAIQNLVGDLIVAYLALWPIGTPATFNGALGFQPWQAVTYAFLHGSVMHFAFNMLALYMFGGEVERAFGASRFLNLFGISVVSAALAQLIVAAIMASPPYPTVGASGGVFGILLAYAILFPHRKVMLLIPPIPLPARVFVALYGVLELYLGVTGTQQGVAHFAHLGGMLGAWLLIEYWRAK